MIGSVGLDRVLCSKHHKGLWKRICVSVNADLTLLHYFKECRLRLGRCTVYLVCQQEVAECGTLSELAFMSYGVYHSKACDI